MRESVFVRLFAGVASDGFNTIPLIPFGQWLLPIGIFLLLAGFRIERSRKVRVLSLYRYGTVLNWWKRHFRKGMASGIGTAVLLLLIVLAWDIVRGNLIMLSVELILKISVLWLCHMTSIAALFALLDLFFARRFIPGALLLFEGLTFIIGYRIGAVSHVMYGMWGMYLQSSLYETGGFLAGKAMGAEAILLMASFFIGWKYLKRETK